MLSRLARDPDGALVRAAKGLYYKSGPADPVFGKRRPPVLDTAVEVARGQGVGPAGPSAAAFLGLTSQVAPRPVLTVVGTKPSGVAGVEWEVRKNPTRSTLNFSEVAVVEFLTVYPYAAEASWGEIVDRVAALVEDGRVDLERVEQVVLTERRKPQLRENFARLADALATRRVAA